MRDTFRAKRTPLYRRIIDEVVEGIASGQLSGGDVLPTRSELAERYCTTKATVDHAMVELARDGVVTAGSGRRTYVNGASKRQAESIAVVWSAPEEHITGSSGDFFGPLIGGIRQACAELLLEVRFRAAQLSTYSDVLKNTGSQGLLVLRPDYSDIPALEALSAQGIPLVTVPGILEVDHVASVSSDNQSGMDTAVQHLISMGHRDIGFVCLSATIPDHFERLQAFNQAMSCHDLWLNPKWICLTHAGHAAEFSRICRDWLNPVSLPTAIIASDFLMGLAAMRGLSELGIAVPRDVSVMSFDDPPAATHLTPAMTVVKQNIGLLAYRGVERLVQLIQSENTATVDRIPTELVIRESTSRPRS